MYHQQLDVGGNTAPTHPWNGQRLHAVHFYAAPPLLSAAQTTGTADQGLLVL